MPYHPQALTHYDFFNESMLDQGSQYRYAAGFEGAARDPLQHALPLISSAPDQAASLLRMALQQMVPPEAWGPPKPAGVCVCVSNDAEYVYVCVCVQQY